MTQQGWLAKVLIKSTFMSSYRLEGSGFRFQERGTTVTIPLPFRHGQRARRPATGNIESSGGARQQQTVDSARFGD